MTLVDALKNILIGEPCSCCRTRARLLTEVRGGGRVCTNCTTEALLARLASSPSDTSLLRAVIARRDDRAVPQLKRSFPTLYAGGFGKDVVRAIAELAPQELWPWLASALRDSSAMTVAAAAFGVGLIQCEAAESDVLAAATEKNGEYVRKGIEWAGWERSSPFVERMLRMIDASTDKRKAELELTGKSKDALVAMLREICGRYAANETGQELGLPAVAIGEELYRRGGISAMQEAHSALHGMHGSRTLDMVWNGIGEWRG